MVNGEYLDSAKYVNRLVQESDDKRETRKIIKELAKTCGLLYVPRERRTLSNWMHKVTEIAYKQIHPVSNPYNSRLLTFFEELKKLEQQRNSEKSIKTHNIESVLEQEDLSPI